MKNLNFIDTGGYTSAIVTLLDSGFSITHEKNILGTSENEGSNNFVIIAEKDGLIIRMDLRGYMQIEKNSSDINDPMYFVSVYKLQEKTIADANSNTNAEAQYVIIGNPIPCLAKSIGWVVQTILKLFS